jgi:hypothetical protein
MPVMQFSVLRTAFYVQCMAYCGRERMSVVAPCSNEVGYPTTPIAILRLQRRAELCPFLHGHALHHFLNELLCLFEPPPRTNPGQLLVYVMWGKCFDEISPSLLGGAAQQQLRKGEPTCFYGSHVPSISVKAKDGSPPARITSTFVRV